MKRAALFLLLLTVASRGDNAFHVDLTLKGPAPVAQNAQAGANAIRGGHVVFRGNIVAGNGTIVFQGPGNATDPNAGPQVPTLHWKNGESLPGELAGASESTLTWKSSLFADPLELKWSVIDCVDWPIAPEEPKDPFGISLRDGSFIYGDVVSVGADTISIRSTRHGNADLKRSEVLSIRRRQNAKLVYEGPTGDLGWEAMTNQQDGSVARAGQADATAPVITGPGGALLIRSWNRSAFLNITLPQAVDLEFQLHSSKRPEFLVALGGNVREPLRVETWDNVLVLAVGDQFKIIRRIQDNERDIALHICWDAKSRVCSVYDPSGAEITTWKVPDAPAQATPGFIVQNRGLDLSLDLLRVRAWDGKAPAKFDSKQPHVELDDGRAVAGAISGGAGGTITVQGSQAASFPLSEVDALVFSEDEPHVSPHVSSLSFNDATLLFGHLAAVESDHLTFATSFTNQPLPVLMDSPRQLLTTYTDLSATAPSGVPQPQQGTAQVDASATPPTSAPPSQDDQDTIVLQDSTLHGKLGATQDGSLGWMLEGAVKAARPATGLSCEIKRALPKDAPLSSDPALFYLTSGDILPGNLRSLDRTGADFESTLMVARKLPAAQIEAIEFSPAARMNVQGFNDPAWQVIKGDGKSIRRNGNSLEMDAGTSIGLESLMECGDFSFKYGSNGFSATRLRLFTAGKDAANSMSILLCSSGGQFTTGQELTPGQMDSQFQIRTTPGAPVTIHVKVENNTVELFANDISAGQFPIDQAKCAGSGVILEPASIWGNGVFTISLSDFAAHTVVGRTWLPEVTSDIKKQVLTVPRFARDDPPRHLLLAANGDVLRGEVEAATDKTFGFRCGLEELQVPRDRVRALIWLQPPPKDNPAAETASAQTPAANPAADDDDAPANPLDDRLPMHVSFQQIDLSAVLNYLRAQDHTLKIQAPDEALLHRVEGVQIGNQTVAEALTQICSRFNLHYRLDPDNTIVLELPATEGIGGLFTKTFWIKPDALPATGSAQDILSAKGISFPKDSSVEWHPQSGVLTMVNTETNQNKLTALLASDYGGSLGSPTHWIELTGGGRLALAVDKFTPDFIEAHQPAYGVIKVPMAQVAAIRTTAPPPTSTALALEDWKLVNAQEPVLPAGNAGNSPLLGKDAPTFQLPLLDGSTFDLSAEKGHIVVLDFWATWCGPCVRSLPGIVELTSAFPADKVKLIGINQGEAPDQVKKFLAAHGLKLTVALDADQSVGRKYGVDAIPRTIIVGPDGKVAWDQTGFDPDGEAAASDVIKKLLDPATAADPPGPKPIP